jgi:hypothetical protein
MIGTSSRRRQPPKAVPAQVGPRVRPTPNVGNRDCDSQYSFEDTCPGTRPQGHQSHTSLSNVTEEDSEVVKVLEGGAQGTLPRNQGRPFKHLLVGQALTHRDAEEQRQLSGHTHPPGAIVHSSAPRHTQWALGSGAQASPALPERSLRWW